MGTTGVYGWLFGDHRGSVSYFRVMEPLRMVATVTDCFHGWNLTPAELERCDTIIAHGLHNEQATETWQWVAQRGTHRLILDVDDAVWAPDYAPMKLGWSRENLERLYDNVRAAHVVTTPSGVIADHLCRINPNVWVVPNTVPAWLCDWEMPARDAPTIGFQGSDSHMVDWTSSQQKHVAKFLNSHPQWKIHTWGSHKVDGPRARNTPWNASTVDYWKTLSMDIGLGPLRDTLFNRAKSDLRAREYLALGIVPVLPHLRPYYGSYVDGQHGRFVYPHQTLSRVLDQVANDPDWMASMSAAGRELARQEFTTEGNLGRIVEAWTSA